VVRRSREAARHIEGAITAMKADSKFRFAVTLSLACLVLTACSGLPKSAGPTGGGSGPYTIGGTVTGLTGTGLVLQDNGGDNLPVAAAGTFKFATTIAKGGAYLVTVVTQPTNPAQSCAVTSGSGTATANVTTVAIACTTAASNATVGVTVAGLQGSGLVLQDNGGDSLTISVDGSYTFKTTVNGAYNVTVLTQPIGPAQVCAVANGFGTATANVTNITVTCTLSYTIGGTVTGLVGTGLILEDNGGDDLAITSSAPFTFKTPVLTGKPYAVTIKTEPASPAQTCVVTAGTGSGTATADVTSVAITCPAVTFSVGGKVVGLLGKQPTPPNNAPLADSSFQLLNNLGDNEIITQNGPFTFPTPVNINGAYNISIISNPSTQGEGCTRWNYFGNATANVTNILVDCAHDDWTWISGSKTGAIDGIGTPLYGSFPATPPTTTPNPYTNTPGGRYAGAAWTDSSGNLWLFGGFGYELAGRTAPDTLAGYLNDVWVCPLGLDQCQWQLLETPVSGLFPIAQSEDNKTGGIPGGRFGSATWVTGGTNLWLFGGRGIDSNFTESQLSDLWKYTIGGGWTLVKGSTVGNQPGVYTGAAGSLVPGARWSPVSWTDNSGNLWLFGGFGYDANGAIGFLNDLWKFDGTNWTFVSASIPSSNLKNQNGVYGTQGTAAAGNTPGGRQSATTWVDAAGNLWLFGGEGLDSAGTLAGAALNDLWEYSITNNRWTWVQGSNTANQDGSYGVGQPSIGPSDTTTAAGTVGLSAVDTGIFPGSRWGSNGWIDAAGRLWLYGGWGLDSTGTNGNGYLNDLWSYTPSSTAGQPGTWTWVKGSNTGNQNGVYGPETRPYVTFVGWTPGGRSSAMSWNDGHGRFWIMGGQGYDSTSTNGNGYLNDLWRYLPYP
jgi:hypothetical protein